MLNLLKSECVTTIKEIEKNSIQIIKNNQNHKRIKELKKNPVSTCGRVYNKKEKKKEKKKRHVLLQNIRKQVLNFIKDG